MEKIETITINEQFESIKANVNENIVSNKINIDFKIEETEKFFIERINIFGNNVTRESVIRNQLEIDEGDPFNEILAKKSKNSIRFNCISPGLIENSKMMEGFSSSEIENHKNDFRLRKKTRTFRSTRIDPSRQVIMTEAIFVHGKI